MPAFEPRPQARTPTPSLHPDPNSHPHPDPQAFTRTPPLTKVVEEDGFKTVFVLRLAPTRTDTCTDTRTDTRTHTRTTHRTTALHHAPHVRGATARDALDLTHPRLAPILPIPLGAYAYVYGTSKLNPLTFAAATCLGTRARTRTRARARARARTRTLTRPLTPPLTLALPRTR